MIRTSALAAILFITTVAASPVLAHGPSGAAGIDITPLLALSRIEVETRYQQLDGNELDKLMFRIGDARSMVRLSPTDH